MKVTNNILKSTLLPQPSIPEPASVQRILVCQLRQLGDVLLATAAIEKLARHYPNAKLDVFTEEKCVPMLEENPHINKIWSLRKKELPTIFQQLAFYWKVARNNYDIVVNFQHLPRCSIVTAFSGAPVRLAITAPWHLRWIYTHMSQPEPGYALSFKTNALRPLGLEWDGDYPTWYVTATEQNSADELLGQIGLTGKRFISVDATHRSALRRWPAKHYAALLDLMAEKFPDLYFMFTYGPGEKAQVEEIFALLKYTERAAMLPEVQTLRHVAACMKRAVMHIGNCSSPRHIAVALGVPSFILLGSTSPAWCFPSPEHTQLKGKELLHLSCSPCTEQGCPQNLRCLYDMTPEIVFPLLCEHYKSFALPAK